MNNIFQTKMPARGKKLIEDKERGALVVEITTSNPGNDDEKEIVEYTDFIAEAVADDPPVFRIITQSGKK